MTHLVSPYSVHGAAPRGWRDWFQAISLAVLLVVFYLSGSWWIMGNARLLRYVVLIGLTGITSLLYLMRPWPTGPNASASVIVAGASFVGVCLVGAAMSKEAWDSFQRAITFLLLIVFGNGWARLNSPGRTGMCIYQGVLVFSVVCCVLALLGAEQVGDRLAVGGIHTNWAGGMFGMSVIVFLVGALAFPGRGWKVGMGVGCMLAAVLLARTQSRTSMLSCLLALGTMSVIVKKLRTSLVAIAGLGLAGVAVLCLVPEYSDQAMTSAERVVMRADAGGDITTGRLSSLQNATWTEFYRSPLFGAGLGGEGTEGVAGELGYVSLLGKTGVLGALALFTWMFLAMRKLWLAVKGQAGSLAPTTVATTTAMTLFACGALMSCGEGYVVVTGNAVTPLMWTISAYAGVLGTSLSHQAE